MHDNVLTLCEAGVISVSVSQMKKGHPALVWWGWDPNEGSWSQALNPFLSTAAFPGGTHELIDKHQALF